MAGKRRGVSYCTNRDCKSYAVLVVLLDLPDSDECAICLRPAKVERERAWRRANSGLCEEVRVQYDFDAERGIYLRSTHRRDSRVLGRHDVYTLQTPIIRTREQAHEIARVVLGRLNLELDKGGQRPLCSSREDLIEQGWPVLV